jgi:hypothetical protein
MGGSGFTVLRAVSSVLLASNASSLLLFSLNKPPGRGEFAAETPPPPPGRRKPHAKTPPPLLGGAGRRRGGVEP